MSRYGVHLMLQYASDLLVEGEDWCKTGVRELREDGSSVWHDHAGWIKPAQMVRAWLKHPGIHFLGNSDVQGIRREEAGWTLQGRNGQELVRSDDLVVANATGCRSLLQELSAHVDLEADVLGKLMSMQELYGTLSYAPMSSGGLAPRPAQWPSSPVNGNGTFVHSIPLDRAPHWFAASTFEPNLAPWADRAGQHQANFQRLSELLPQVGESVRPAFEQGLVSAWASSRCVSHDRLPLVGPLLAAPAHSLWLCVGMGSRGLSFSALCAQMLVAQMCGEPLPIEASLARNLSATRPRRKRKNGA